MRDTHAVSLVRSASVDPSIITPVGLRYRMIHGYPFRQNGSYELGVNPDVPFRSSAHLFVGIPAMHTGCAAR
jgi:hypothetical protein